MTVTTTTVVGERLTESPRLKLDGDPENGGGYVGQRAAAEAAAAAGDPVFNINGGVVDGGDVCVSFFFNFFHCFISFPSFASLSFLNLMVFRALSFISSHMYLPAQHHHVLCIVTSLFFISPTCDWLWKKTRV